jgi:hypothetical protein
MLLDTSGLCCLFHRAESVHDEAKRLFDSTDWAPTHSQSG